MNLGEIYETVLDLLGKDTYGGLIAPPLFSRACQKVNLDFTEEYIRVLDDNQLITDDTFQFVKTLGDNEFPPLTLTSFGYGELPSDYVRYVSARHAQYYNANCTTATAKIRPIEMLSYSHFNMRLRAGMYYPTKEKPIATIQNDKLYVQPIGIPSVVFSYFREPATPYYDFDIVTATGQPIYLPPNFVHGEIPNTTVNPDFTAGDPSLSVEFEWTPPLDTKIINSIVGYFRVNIKDNQPPVEYPVEPPPVNV